MISSHISIRRTSLLMLLCLAATLLLASCRLPWQHSPFNGTGSKPTAQQLLAAVRKSFSSVNAFHVVMRVQNAGSTTGSQFQIRNADGDVVLPDKIKAQATIILSGQAVTINLISIGDTQFITDPITGQWRVIKGALITGKLEAKTLAFITGGGVPANTALQTSECIGKDDSLLYQVIVTGRAAVSYTPQTTLTFLLSNYNEHITITAPQT